jgi:hypothetical protein
MEALHSFDPVVYNMAECQWLKDKLGQPPVVAFQDGLPPGVNASAVRPILERVYELEEIRRHRGREWAGVQMLVASIDNYVRLATKWRQDRKRGAPRFPSMHTFDGRGRAHSQAPGSDNGQVRTYFNQDGSRTKFAIELIPDTITPWEPEWQTGKDETISGIKVDMDMRRVECQVCGHTETFKPESRASLNAARARMSKHLRSTTDRVEEHRELHAMEFGQAS